MKLMPILLKGIISVIGGIVIGWFLLGSLISSMLIKYGYIGIYDTAIDNLTPKIIFFVLILPFVLVTVLIYFLLGLIQKKK